MNFGVLLITICNRLLYAGTKKESEGQIRKRSAKNSPADIQISARPYRASNTFLLLYPCIPCVLTVQPVTVTSHVLSLSTISENSINRFVLAVPSIASIRILAAS